MANNSCAADTDAPIIQTSHGQIRGRVNTSVYDDRYYSFERIPFAQPPVGELRFKAPQPVQQWEGVLDCTEKPDKPLQTNPMTRELEGSENCLYLNVYAKKLKSDKPLPIMVFLFGGGFERGCPTRDLHGPDYLMMKDVVFVTIAYRVGCLGFLSLPDPSANVPGNAGLKDQLLGLQWLASNASAFNGDRNNITLFGESAGSASVHYLMCCPQAKGLFHKAIMMSGAILCQWALCPLQNLPRRLAQATGLENCDTKSDTEILEHLRSRSGKELLTPNLLTREENLDDCLFTFGPTVEPYISDNCMIPKQPTELLETAWANDIPLMIGGTSFEGLLMFARVMVMPFLLEELRDNSQHMLPLEFKRNWPLEKQKDMGSKIKQTHFGDDEVNLKNVLRYCEYATYKIFWHPIIRSLRYRLRNATAPTYLYRFDFDSPDFNHQRIKYCGKEMRGVAHVDDRSYLFYGTFSWKLNKDTAEYKTLERMVDMWTSFAAHSNPNCNEIANIEWLPLTKQNEEQNHFPCLNISEEVKIIDLPEMKKLQAWDQLYETV